MRRAVLCLQDNSPEAPLWRLEAEHYLALIERVIHQTRRRVIDGESVPAGEKLVSLFEPHADIIVKSRRGVQYGHKLNLTSGRSGLILDVVVEAGNPADAVRFKPMLDRHIALYGKPPRQAVADAGYASLDNLKQAKAIGVRDVAFHSKRGLAIEDMVKSKWVYRRLRNFRAGIEAGISCLKRAYGLARCTWRGLDHFKSYVWSSVVAYNLSLFARLLLPVTTEDTPNGMRKSAASLPGTTAAVAAKCLCRYSKHRRRTIFPKRRPAHRPWPKTGPAGTVIGFQIVGNRPFPDGN